MLDLKQMGSLFNLTGEQGATSAQNGGQYQTFPAMTKESLD